MHIVLSHALHWSSAALQQRSGAQGTFACRYIKNGFGTYWENGNVEAALVPHPTLTATATAGK